MVVWRVTASPAGQNISTTTPGGRVYEGILRSRARATGTRGGCEASASPAGQNMTMAKMGNTASPAGESVCWFVTAIPPRTGMPHFTYMSEHQHNGLPLMSECVPEAELSEGRVLSPRKSTYFWGTPPPPLAKLVAMSQNPFLVRVSSINLFNSPSGGTHLTTGGPGL